MTVVSLRGSLQTATEGFPDSSREMTACESLSAMEDSSFDVLGWATVAAAS
jgi:hypothetical protein